VKETTDLIPEEIVIEFQGFSMQFSEIIHVPNSEKRIFKYLVVVNKEYSI